MKRNRLFPFVSFLALAGSMTAQPVVELPAFPVWESWTAIPTPASGFSAPVSLLRQEIRVDLQTRGLTEGQADVTIRGGIFENTGFRLGTLALFDPQTGHYFAELPFDPAMLSAPRVLVGSENAVRGFNSTIGTVAYDWQPIATGGTMEAGLGEPSLNSQRVYLAWAAPADAALHGWAVDLGGARAIGEGTVDFGDHHFNRLSGRIQHRTDQGQTDIFAGYMDKFYGWPGMYIGQAFGRLFHETDTYEQTVFGAQHRQAYGTDSHWALGGYFRELINDYDFDRTISAGSNDFRHLTRVLSASLSGQHVGEEESFSVDYHLTWLKDDLVRSTSLTFGPYTERTYWKGVVLPSYHWEPATGQRVAISLGASYDDNNEGDAHVSPLARVAWTFIANRAETELFLDFAETAQVPGYTVLGSNPNGLFGGNAAAGREVAQQLELGVSHRRDRWGVRAAVFYREVDDQTDWTFTGSTTSARRALPVDLTTWGTELQLDRQWEGGRVSLGYQYLNKGADYAQADALNGLNEAILGSYYALNYPRHRLVLTGQQTWWEQLTAQAEAEWRQEVENPLRTGARDGFRLNLGLSWAPSAFEGWSLSANVDNVTDENLEEFPGTPATGRQGIARLAYSW